MITNTNPRNTRVNNFSLGNKRMFNSIQNKKNKKIKENKKNKKMKYKSMTTNRFLYGFRRRSPGYSIYNQTGKSGLVLPPITQEKKLVRKLGSKEKEKQKKKIIENGSEESGSRSGNEDDDGGSRNGSEN